MTKMAGEKRSNKTYLLVDFLKRLAYLSASSNIYFAYFCISSFQVRVLLTVFFVIKQTYKHYLFFSKGPFNTVLWSFVKTAIMMLGEIDYTDIIVEAKDQFSDESGAPLAPIPEFSATLVLLFCIMVSVLLMNLLVSEQTCFAKYLIFNFLSRILSGNNRVLLFVQLKLKKSALLH